MFTSLLSYDESIVKDSKRAPNLFSNIIKVVKESNMNSDLTNEEKNILSYIKRIVKRKKDYTFVVENICAWNHNSISLFNSLFRLLNINKNHAYKWIFTSNCKEESLLIKNEFTINTYTYDLVIMDSMTIEDFTSCLKFFDDQNFYLLNDYSSLYKIIESYIEAIKYICNSKFMDNRVDEEVDKFSLIKKIIEDKIKALTSDSDLIFQTMEYIGILNKMVSVDELSYFLEITEGKIREVVEEAYSNYLLNYNDVQKKYIDFALDIIKTIYSEMSIHDRRYYDKIAKCIKKIYPSEYEKRGDLLIEAGENSSASICYVLEAISQLRNNKFLSVDIKNKLSLFSEKSQIYFIECYGNAINYISQNQYDEALNQLELLPPIMEIEFSAERDIMKSLCFTKKFENRQNALDILIVYKDVATLNNEIDIYERMLDRKLFANVHLGKIEEAKMIENELVVSFRNRIKYDVYASEKLIGLYIRSNSIFSAEISLSRTESAHKIFDSMNINKISLYYSILTNESAANILNGEFKKAYDLCKVTFNLMQTEEFIKFPRKEIVYSNYILAGYLCGELNISLCIKESERLIGLSIGAERLFLTSNYCIFLSIANEHKKAFDILYNEAILQSINKLDKENIYNFRVCYNLAVFSYLSCDIDNCASYIEKLRHICIGKIDQDFIKEKIDIAITLMTGKDRFKVENWLYAFFNYSVNMPIKSWRYYGLGYAFTALSNWNDV